jgi:hypothetical protein
MCPGVGAPLDVANCESAGRVTIAALAMNTASFVKSFDPGMKSLLKRTKSWLQVDSR